MTENTKEFLNSLREKGFWNNDYDYSEVNFINFKLTPKVILRDKVLNTKHEVNSWRLYNNNSKCVGENVIDKTDYFLKKLKLAGHFNENIDYSKVKVIGVHQKVKLIDKKLNTVHLLKPSALLGRNTPLQISNAVDKTKYFLSLAKSKNRLRDDHDYSNLKYVDSKTPIEIICKKHNTVHLFNPNTFLNKFNVCIAKNAKNKEKYYLIQLRKIHGNKYDYSQVDFDSNLGEVKIICKIHDIFKQSMSTHLNGHGCPKCSRNRRHDNKSIIEEFKKVHGDRYDYSLVNYTLSRNKIKIICHIHGEFEQTANNHQRGKGCPTCNLGWNTERIINYINDIANKDILSMDPVELNMLIAQGKLPSEFEELVFKLEGTGENSLKSLKEKLGIEDKNYSEQELNKLVVSLDEMTSESQEEMTDALEAMSQPQLEELELESEIELKKRKNLPNISNADILVLDKELINTCDDEAVEFFIQYKLRKVWNEILNDKRGAKDIKALNGGKNSSRLRDLFIEEYNDIFFTNLPKVTLSRLAEILLHPI